MKVFRIINLHSDVCMGLCLYICIDVGIYIGMIVWMGILLIGCINCNGIYFLNTDEDTSFKKGGWDHEL